MADDFTIKVDGEKLVKELQRLSDAIEGVLDGLSGTISFEQRKALMQIDHQNKMARRAYEVSSRVGGIFGSGSGLSGFTNIIQGFAMMRRLDTKNLAALNEKIKSGGKLSTEDEAEKARLIKTGAGESVFDKLTDRFDKIFGSGSKWDTLFKGHGKEMALGLGSAGVGGGLALGKAIIDSSPAFQQLLKLMNFGFMLILRPIGDFFFFLFRPILLMLLRMFIIPFYKYVYPWFAQYGSALGEGFATIVSGNWAKGLAESFKVKMADFFGEPKGTAPDDSSSKATNQDKANKFMETEAEKTKQSKGAAQEALDKFTSGTKPSPTAGIAEAAMNDFTGTKILKQAAALKTVPAVTTTSKILPKLTKVAKIADRVAGLPAEVAMKAGKVAYTGAKAAVTPFVPKPVKDVTKTLTTKATQATAKLATNTAIKTATKAIPVVGQALLAIDAAGSIVKGVNPELYENIRQGTKGIFEPILGKDITEGILDFAGWGEQSTAEQLYGLAETAGSMLTGHTVGTNTPNSARTNKGSNAKQNDPVQALASGGLITEPILGIGKSGKKYMMGERGAEFVIPASLGLFSKPKISDSHSQQIVINVYGDVNDRTMAEFKRKVLEVLRESNARRGA